MLHEFAFLFHQPGISAEGAAVFLRCAEGIGINLGLAPLFDFPPQLSIHKKPGLVSESGFYEETEGGSARLTFSLQKSSPPTVKVTLPILALAMELSTSMTRS